MDWGMKNRLSQLIQSDGHCFFLPIDHGYFQGPTRCLEKPGDNHKAPSRTLRRPFCHKRRFAVLC